MEDVKTKLSCETSLQKLKWKKDVKTKLSCETFLKKWKVKMRKRGFRARLPSKSERGPVTAKHLYKKRCSEVGRGGWLGRWRRPPIIGFGSFAPFFVPDLRVISNQMAFGPETFPVFGTSSQMAWPVIKDCLFPKDKMGTAFETACSVFKRHERQDSSSYFPTWVGSSWWASFEP